MPSKRRPKRPLNCPIPQRSRILQSLTAQILTLKLPLTLTLTLTLTLQAQQSFTIPNGQATIHYRVFGKGDPILIINGGPGMNSDGFMKLAEQFGQHYQAIIFDQRGTGKSTVSPVDTTTITMQAMVSDMEALRKHLHFKKWHVLGQSFGGMLAAYYATQCPASIDRMVLCASGGIDLGLLDYIGDRLQGRLSQAERDTVAYWDAKIAQGDTSFFAKIHRATALAPAYIENREYIPTIANRLTQNNPFVNGLVWQDLQNIGFNCAPDLQKFKRPVLILQGKQDIINEETALKAHKAIPQSKLIWLDRCSHYAWLDRPDVFWPEVNDFLK